MKQIERLIYAVLGLLCLLYLGGCGDKEQEVSDDQRPTEEVYDLSPESNLRAELSSLNTQIERESRSYSLFQQRSLVYYYLNREDSAVLDVEKALKLYPDGPELHYLRGFYAFVADDTARAMNAFKKAAFLGSVNPETFYQMGQIFFLQGKYAEALREYDEAIALDSLEPTYVFAKGLLYEQQSNYPKAIKEYKTALTLDSAFVKSFSRLHDIALAIQKDEKAALDYTKQLLTYHPEHPLGRFNLGNHFYREGYAITDEKRVAEADSLFRRAIVQYTFSLKKDSTYTDAYYNRGNCYFLTDQYEEAIQDFQKTLALQPKHARAHFMLGSLFEHYKDISTALQHYQSALDADPSFTDAANAVKELSK